MALMSTLKADRLPSLGDDAVYQNLAPPDPHSVGCVLWQVVTTPLWAWLGGTLGDSLPHTVFAPPRCYLMWGLAAVALVVFLARFTRHYAWICTAQLMPDERRARRAKLSLRAMIWALTYPITAPLGWLCSLVCLPAFGDAWTQWFTYDRDYCSAPGILQSPSGIQPIRVWHYRLTVMVVAGCTIDTIGVSPVLFSAAAAGPVLPALWRLRREK